MGHHLADLSGHCGNGGEFDIGEVPDVIETGRASLLIGGGAGISRCGLQGEVLSGPSFLKPPLPALPYGVHGLLLSSRSVFSILVELSSVRVKNSIRIIYVPLQGRRGHNLTNVWGQLVSTAFFFLFHLE